MYRRIELINGNIKHGLCGISFAEVSDAWIYKLHGPKGNVPINAKFYFTELGWKEVGRSVIEQCQKVKQEYRVIAIKEKSVNVVWRDNHYGLEVAAQPKKGQYYDRR